MLDLGFVRANLPLVEEKLRLRGIDPAEKLGLFQSADIERRDKITASESRKAEINRLSAEIGAQNKAGNSAKAEELKESVRQLKYELELFAGAMATCDRVVREILESLPNLPHDSVPAGKSEHDNFCEKTWGTPKTFDFPAKPHWEIGEQLGILDFERAAKISGSRFVVQFGAGARLERALANFMLDLHTKEHGYVEVLPPFMVNSKSLFGTGQLPKFAADLFHCDDKGAYEPGSYQENDHWLIPTAEVPVTNIFREETIDLSGGAISFVAYTPCFRSEAGS
jgi:seryl-tRNA synthetase